jgi:sterol desaturase/sphingolipid hydroxylase (fatty acid hydroxylase superfamily)
MSAYLYPIALAIISAAVMLAEWLAPWRPGQRQLRRWFVSDLAHLVFNGHFLGVILWGISTHHLLPRIDAALGPQVTAALYRGLATHWPLWVQIPVVLLVVDFIHWCIHNLLHRVPFLWELHKTHHSVGDGEMDWIVSFRFQWTEVVVYKTLQYFPLAFFGFGGTAIMVHAIFGTLIGHLNHSNLNLSYGPLRYLLNSPRMHIWHHDYDGTSRTTVNFGIIFSMWDWIFGTAKMPDAVPARIGFRGDDRFPRDFLSQTAWPASKLFGARRMPAVTIATAALGAALIGVGWWLHFP